MDLLLSGGTVWTGGTAPADHDAIAISAGRVVALSADALAWAAGRAGVEHVDLGGAFLMPAFGDGHAHPVQAGLERQGPQIRSCRSVAAIVAEVARYAAEHPEPAWVTGASYDSSLAPDGVFDSRWLDEAVPDRPVMLRAWDYHTVWCNGAALAAAGIDRDTPEPELGQIVRRADGTPAGTMREWGAVDLVMRVAPVAGAAARVRALDWATREYARLGVTWVQDAWVDGEDLDGYLAAARAGALHTRVNLALRADPRTWPAQLSELCAARERVHALADPRLGARTVKFFADGIVESGTAALLQPYADAAHAGIPVWAPEALADAVRDVVAVGFQPHIHTIGDGAVRAALDAVEQAPGSGALRPVLAHVQLVDTADLPRFAGLGVIANAEPLWCQLDDIMVLLTAPRLGPERTARQYPLASLLRSGATVSFGSDWPVSSPNPLEGIGVAVTRQTPAGNPAGGWVPRERLSVEQSLVAYTAGVAHQAFADDRGRLAPGAVADLVLLDHDPRATAGGALSGIQVLGTWLAGEVTYRR